MGARRRKLIRKKLADKKARLELYKAQERKMLEDGVKQYGIGSRNLARYDIDLSALQDEIEKLEDEIDALEAELDGCKARKVVAVVPRDW